MSVIATVELDARGSLLGDALSDNPDLEVQLERVVPLGGSLAPYLWVDDGSVETVEHALEAEDDITAFDILDQLDGEMLVRAEWADSADGLLRMLAETDVVLLTGTGTRGRWRFELRFANHDRLAAFYRRCTDHGLTVDVRQVQNPGGHSGTGVDARLTDRQREALELALAEGYFEVPRRIDLAELGERLGISDTAVSQRLRRGIAAVLAGLDESA